MVKQVEQTRMDKQMRHFEKDHLMRQGQLVVVE